MNWATGWPLDVAGSHIGDWETKESIIASNSSQTLSSICTFFTLPSSETTKPTFMVPECLQPLGATIL